MTVGKIITALVILSIGYWLGGRLADRWGRTRVMFLGAVLFFVSSILSGIAFGVWDLILWRAMAGIGIGTRLSDIVMANGAPVTFAGFEWQYSGYIMGWNGGLLDRDHRLGEGIYVYLAARPPYLPADYDPVARRYPALYLNDGESYLLSARASEIMDSLLAQGEIVPALLVFVQGQGPYGAESLRNPEILDLTRRVRYHVDPQYPGPGRFKGAVRIELTDGRVVEEIEEYNRGSQENPMSYQELRAKFEENASGILTAAQASKLAETIRGLETLDDAAVIAVQASGRT